MVLSLMALSGPAGSQPPASVFRQYVQPYADTHNFSGAVLVVRDGKVLFEKAYGYSDNAAKRSNRPDTQFHIASMSMQFTAAAVMRLVDAGKLSLSTHVGELAPNIPNGDRITVRQLLEETSGLPDINGFPEYEQILQQHQTPASLVQYVRGKAAAAEPGGAFQSEEHSAYNLLALIVEQKTGLPFAEAVNALVFSPLHMGASRVDDDAPVIAIITCSDEYFFYRAKGSVFKFDAGSKLRFGENDEVKIFRGALTFGFRPSLGQREFRTRTEPTNMAKKSRIHGSIFAEEIAVRVHLLELFDGSLQSPLQGDSLRGLAHRRTHRNARMRT
jgi:hypothetical protein